jgi:glycosyltransferase involved in cell wall biosynthesis
MTVLNGLFDLGGHEQPTWQAERAIHANGQAHAAPPSAEVLRRVAWEIGERRPGDAFTPPASHVALGMVGPAEGFAHWRILTPWVEETAWHKGEAWRDCRLVLRLYDVSFIDFNGLNAHRIQDETLPALVGQRFFRLPRPGTSQIGEVGFLLRNGEFVPAARSAAVAFARDNASPHGDHAGLLVTERGRVLPVRSVWEQERIVRELHQPKLRAALRVAAFSFATPLAGHQGPLATLVAELSAGQCAAGHEVHVFTPRTAALAGDCQVSGIHYHPLDLNGSASPPEAARAFARAAQQRLSALPAFDLFQHHEWMTALVPRPTDLPTVLALGSVEATRRNGCPPSALSRQIEADERDAAARAGLILTPDWLRERAAAALEVDNRLIHAFPMEGRLANEWECPLDPGQVKMGVGVGPLDRMLLFVGPLEHAAGPDLLLEALPVLLQRAGNLRLVFAGGGNLHGSLHHRAGQLGVAHAVRLLGHVDRAQVVRLMRAAEALILPSRYRVPQDDAVVDLARRAARPVVTTHGGPAHLVRHEETGILTYDNPGSMVWAVDRILGDPAHAERMGHRGWHGSEGSAPRWAEVTRRYLELCATIFPDLAELRP